MADSLKTIQILHKVGKVLSIIALVACVIGAVGCTVGAISLACIPGDLVVDGKNIIDEIEKESGMSIESMYASMAALVVLCVSEAVVAYFALKYFDRELAVGTPFTFAGAKELQKVGIITIVAPIIGIVVSAIVVAVMELAYGSITSPDYGNAGSIAVGIMFLVISVFCKYGAEVEEERKASE